MYKGLLDTRKCHLIGRVVMPVYANLESREGTLTGDLTLTFRFKVRRLVITNDHRSNNLKVKFNASENFLTLAGSETLALDIVTDELIMQGTAIPYRVWGVG